MRKFQILDREGTPIKLEELDSQVCNLQGKTRDPKYYCGFADPKEYPDGKENARWIADEMTSNWYDTIGWLIAERQKSLPEIIDHYAEVMSDFIGKTDESGKKITLEDCYPYRITLLKDWINKGYVAKSLE